MGSILITLFDLIHNLIISTCSQYYKLLKTYFTFGGMGCRIKSSNSDVHFVLTAHLIWNQPHFKCSVAPHWTICACLLQSCLTLCPMDCIPPGSSVHRILQARILEWVAMPSSKGSSWPRDQTSSLMSPSLLGGFFTTSATWEAPCWTVWFIVTSAS